jgi:hypothetical protein
MKEILENLKINTMEGKLINNKIKWYGYFLRMNKDKILKKNVNKKMKEKHRRERQRSRWDEHQVRKDIT